MIALKINEDECRTSVDGNPTEIAIEALIGINALIKVTAEVLEIPVSDVRNMVSLVSDATKAEETLNIN